MECKNCQNNLRTDFSFCPVCGAKIIRNKLTIKNLWGDITERYFNIDNTFLKTFWHLFYKPEVVIEGYINGVRRKYLNPISYLGIALTLSGLIVFLIKKAGSDIDFDVFGMGTNSIGQDKVMEFTFDYQSVLFILYIPIMSIAGWLCFQEKNYNFSERLVIFMYTLAHYSIIIFIPSVLLLIFVPENFAMLSFISLLFMYLYSAYVIKRVSEGKGIELIARILMFWVLFSIMYFCFTLLTPMLLIVFGDLQLQDFKPINIK